MMSSAPPARLFSTGRLAKLVAAINGRDLGAKLPSSSTFSIAPTGLGSGGINYAKDRPRPHIAHEINARPIPMVI